MPSWPPHTLYSYTLVSFFLPTLCISWGFPCSHIYYVHSKLYQVRRLWLWVPRAKTRRDAKNDKHDIPQLDEFGIWWDLGSTSTYPIINSNESIQLIISIKIWVLWFSILILKTLNDIHKPNDYDTHNIFHFLSNRNKHYSYNIMWKIPSCYELFTGGKWTQLHAIECYEISKE